MPIEKLSAEKKQELVDILKTRFDANMDRHKKLEWSQVLERLEANAEKLWSLDQMERTGGEPDVVGVDGNSGEIILVDCSKQSPKGRRSLCYDPQALASRKQHKPKDSAINMAAEMGIEILTEDSYRELQELGEFDTTTSSWVKTPQSIRDLGGAIFCDRRFNHVFTYHNGAESYYAARGFRGSLRI